MLFLQHARPDSASRCVGMAPFALTSTPRNERGFPQRISSLYYIDTTSWSPQLVP